jgi:hypothetical protein
MDDDIGDFQRLDGTHRQQAGIARTGADKDHAPTRIWIEQGNHGAQMAPHPALRK